MRRIAVIGFRKLSDFEEWCIANSLTKIRDKIYRNSVGIEFIGIFTEDDLIGRRFEDFIEIDYLKDDLMRRIN